MGAVLRCTGFALALMICVGCSTAPITGRRQLLLMSSNEMSQMSAQQYKQVLSESTIVKGGPQLQSLRRVAGRLAAAVTEYNRTQGSNDAIVWETNLIKADDTVNAWAMPGGKIAFYTGIMKVCRDDKGIAVVMAHEMAHVLAKHGNERFSQAVVTQLGMAALDTALKQKPDETRKLWMGAIGTGVQLGVLMPYSRTHEFEADYIGAVLMAKAGYDPREAASFWKRMMALGGKKPPELLSTHPADQKRIDALNQNMPEILTHYRKRRK